MTLAKKRFAYVCVLLSLLSQTSVAQEYDYVDSQVRIAIAQDNPVEAGKLVNLCFGGRHSPRISWCEGYFSAVTNELGLSMGDSCLPGTDMLKFLGETVWMATNRWLQEQSPDLLITLKGAILEALVVKQGCDI